MQVFVYWIVFSKNNTSDFFSSDNSRLSALNKLKSEKNYQRAILK